MNLDFRSRSLVVDDTWTEFWGRVAEGLWEPNTYNVFDFALKPGGMTYVDIGAWIGPTILYAAPMAARALAVEPDPVAFDLLSRNVAANGLKVELYKEAITNFDGSIQLGSSVLGASITRANPIAAAGCAAWDEGQTFLSPCTTLRRFITLHEVTDPLFIKMDIEGGEEFALTDFEFFAERKPVLYISLHPFWWQSEAAWEVIRKVGRLYNHVYNDSLSPVDINTTELNALLFMDTQ